MNRHLTAALMASTLIGITPPTRAAEPASKTSPHVEPSGADVSTLTEAISATRRKFFADAMSGLTAQQLEAFWSVYADFEKEKTQLATARVEALKTFLNSMGSATGLTDADTAQAVRDLAELQKKLTDLRLKYFDIYSKRIDVKTAGRFAMVDDFVATSIRLDWLKQIPFPGDEFRK